MKMHKITKVILNEIDITLKENFDTTNKVTTLKKAFESETRIDLFNCDYIKNICDDVIDEYIRIDEAGRSTYQGRKIINNRTINNLIRDKTKYAFDKIDHLFPYVINELYFVLRRCLRINPTENYRTETNMRYFIINPFSKNEDYLRVEDYINMTNEQLKTILQIIISTTEKEIKYE